MQKFFGRGKLMKRGIRNNTGIRFRDNLSLNLNDFKTQSLSIS